MASTFSSYSKAQALRSGGKTPVREALLDARSRTLALAQAYADALSTVQMRVPYATELNPPLWELGHVAWFQDYWVSRNRQRSLGVRCDPGHERAPSPLPQADRWYDSSRVEHRSRWDLQLPDLQATRDHLAGSLDRTLQLLDALDEQASDDDLYFFRLVVLHEAMHAEAAVYMARKLGIALPEPEPAVASAESAAVSVHQLGARLFRVGDGGTGFAFDNELMAHEVVLAPFEIDARPVSWGRFAGFIEAGGYRQRQWWSAPGWDWLQQHGRPAPELPSASEVESPAVHLSAHEAEAWCRWAGRRLPTEAEWECAALKVPGFDWGRVWEWTASPFRPYPGFSPHPYSDYSQPWFGSRRVLKGACAATSPWLAHPRYRNFFEPQRGDIFAGFRSCA